MSAMETPEAGPTRKPPDSPFLAWSFRVSDRLPGSIHPWPVTGDRFGYGL